MEKTTLSNVAESQSTQPEVICLVPSHPTSGLNGLPNRIPTKPKVVSIEHTDQSTLSVVPDNLCSYCSIGLVDKYFTFAGVLLCFICFPCGFIWLFWLREERCNYCGKMYH